MRLKNFAILFFLLFTSCVWINTAVAMNYLEQYFAFSANGNNAEAQKKLLQWTPKTSEETFYKRFFLALNKNKAEDYWTLYRDLNKKNKLIKLQHEAIRQIILLDLSSEDSITKKFKSFKPTAKSMLKKLQFQPEGVDFETNYLKWAIKNRDQSEICKTERSRWISQENLSLSEISLGLDSCPLTYNDFLYRIRMLIYAGAEHKVQQEIQEYSLRTKMVPWRQAYLQAVYSTNLGDPVTAYRSIQKFESEIKEDKEYYDNFFYITQRAGDLAKAEQIVNDLIQLSKNAKEKREFLYQKAFLFYQVKRYHESIRIVGDLLKTPRLGGKERDDLMWLKGWCEYLEKNYLNARETLEENLKNTRDKARTMYWLAQTEWALDNKLQSISYLRQLANPLLNAESFTYYNLLGWIRYQLRKSSIDLKAMQSQVVAINRGNSLYDIPHLDADPMDVVRKYKEYFDNVIESDDGTIQILNRDDLFADLIDTRGIQTRNLHELNSELSWADSLIKGGYRNFAKWHLFELESRLRTRSEADPLIQYYLDNQYYYRALSLMQKTNNTVGKKLSLSDEGLLWKSLYPKAYETSVKKHAEKSSINPYWVWSIMKAETQFKADAISPVGAIGLMQFMPYTSNRVANMIRDNSSNDQLFEPDIAIKYGAAYLKKLSDEMSGQLPLIAAAYNGGPHRVKLWLKNLKQRDGSNMEFDQFVEHIPFNETRTYVKRVVSYFYSYQKLYEERLDLASTKWLVEKNPIRVSDNISLKEEWPADDKMPASEYRKNNQL